MTTKLVFNHETKRMEKVENGGEMSSSSWEKGNVTFIVKGEMLGSLVQFATEDELDTSTPQKRGQVVNAYIRAAVEGFIASRSEATSEAAESDGASDTSTRRRSRAS